MPSIRLVRFAKLTALIADVLTIFCAVLIVGWQIIVFLKDGSWPALPLSFVFGTPGYNQGEVYSTASISKTGGSWAINLNDVLLQVPAIVLLLLASAFLTAFYSWLSRLEKDLTGTQM